MGRRDEKPMIASGIAAYDGRAGVGAEAVGLQPLCGQKGFELGFGAGDFRGAKGGLLQG